MDSFFKNKESNDFPSGTKRHIQAPRANESLFDTYEEFRPIRKRVEPVRHEELNEALPTRRVLTQPRIIPDAAGVTSKQMIYRSDFNNRGMKHYNESALEKREISNNQYTSITPIGASSVNSARVISEEKRRQLASDPFGGYEKPTTTQKKIVSPATYDHMAEDPFAGFRGVADNKAINNETFSGSRKGSINPKTDSIDFSPIPQNIPVRPYSQQKYSSDRDTIIHKSSVDTSKLVTESELNAYKPKPYGMAHTDIFAQNIYGFATTDLRKGPPNNNNDTSKQNYNFGKEMKARDLIGNGIF